MQSLVAARLEAFVKKWGAQQVLIALKSDFRLSDRDQSGRNESEEILQLECGATSSISARTKPPLGRAECQYPNDSAVRSLVIN